MRMRREGQGRREGVIGERKRRQKVRSEAVLAGEKMSKKVRAHVLKGIMTMMRWWCRC